MERKFFFVIFSLAFVFLIANSERILACSCVANVPACQRLGYADAIFTGKVLSVRTDGAREFTTFEIQEVISGAPNEQITVQNREGMSCDISFEQGETYLIFAGGNPQQGYSSYHCAGNRLISEAQDLLIELRALASQESRGKLYGRVSESLKKRVEESLPMPGINLTIREIGGKRSIYRAVTDSNGNYELIVPPGKYKVLPTIPQYAKLGLFSEDPVSVKNQGCYEKHFTVGNNAQVTGKILDSKGRPVPEIRVELVPVDEEARLFAGENSYSDEKGEFTILSVPAGLYTLSVNFGVEPDLDSPFPTTFYPSVFEREKAKIFDIGLGQSINNIIFRLPPRLKTQTITGTVVFPDGRPASEMTVNLQEDDSDTSFSYTRTDENGRFSVRGFRGEKYNFGVVYYGDDNAKADYTVKKFVFTLDENTQHFRLVLEKKSKEG